MLKRFVIALLVVAVAGSAFAFTPGTYEGEGKGYSEGSPVKVKVTVDADKITAVEIDAPEEVPFGVQNFENYKGQLIGKSEAKIDAVSNATMTRDGIVEAVNKALSQARGEAAESNAPLSFNAGDYEAEGMGYNGPVKVKATFTASKMIGLEVTSHTETPHVGDIAFGIMIPEMLDANGSGVDAVSGATFSTRALRNAVNSAAECASVDSAARQNADNAAVILSVRVEIDGFNRAACRAVADCGICRVTCNRACPIVRRDVNVRQFDTCNRCVVQSTEQTLIVALCDFQAADCAVAAVEGAAERTIS